MPTASPAVVILIGALSLWIAALMSAWCAVVSFTGANLGRDDLVASGRRAVYVSFGALLLGIAGLGNGLLTHDLSLAYVAAYTTANLPTLYSVSALWSGPGGSMLVWAAVLAAYLAASVVSGQRRGHADMPWLAGSVATLLAVWVLTLALRFAPFARLDFIPADGQGMAPALQTPGMAVRPPLMAMGYLATAIPFALAFTALAVRRLDMDWVRRVHPWALLSWALVTSGLVVGMYRVYAEPASTAAWAWDPVATGSLLPWVCITGTLIVCGVGERRRAVPRWAVTLVVATFLLCMRGLRAAGDPAATTGWPSVVPDTGIWAAIAVMVATGVTSYYVSTRLPREARAGASAGVGEAGPASPAVGAPHSGARGRVTSAGFVTAAGLVLLASALTGWAFRSEHAVSLRTGEEFRVADPLGHQWRFVSQGASNYASLNRKVLAALTLEAWRDGRPRGLVTSEVRQYVDDMERPLFEPTTVAGIRHLPLNDTYVVLAGVEDDLARLRIAFNPLISCAWIGGVLFVVGGVILGWPTAGRSGE